MKPTFNLIQRPWIPCVRLDGTHVELSLSEALGKAHTLRTLHGESPLVIAALYRLLLALLHRVYEGPKSWEAWKCLWDMGRWDARRIDTYLREWHHRFDLFDPERPFYQAADLSSEEPGTINRLVHHMASGSNATLFDHHMETESPVLTPAQAARALVAIQAFGLGGFGMGRSYHVDAPCTRGIIFLVQGDTLFETLALNLLRYPDEALPGQGTEDCPVWEMEDPLNPKHSVPLGYVHYLTWQNRRILLFPEMSGQDVVVRRMQEASAPRLADGIQDPMKHYNTGNSSSGPRPLQFREGRALWRDSAALFQLDAEGSRPPRIFDWLADLVMEGYLDAHQTRRYMALGMSKRQQKVNFYRAERMPLPLEYLQKQELVEDLARALTMAEATANKLWGATRTLARFAIEPEADLEEGREPAPEEVNRLLDHWAIDRHYWNRLEIPFRRTMQRLPQEREAALSDWQQTLRRAAWAAFEQAASDLRHDPRKLKAVVRAQNHLGVGLKEALPNETVIV